jgi:hypothetical protein
MWGGVVTVATVTVDVMSGGPLWLLTLEVEEKNTVATVTVDVMSGGPLWLLTLEVEEKKTLKTLKEKEGGRTRESM